MLSCNFIIRQSEFLESNYKDEKTEQNGPEGVDWKYWIDDKDKDRIRNFFVRSIHMGDIYSAGQAGAMGPGAQASNITFQQIWNQSHNSNRVRYH